MVMNFKDIAIKNFKGNCKRYIAYFLCNSFIVMTYLMYSTLMFNEDLINSTQIEQGVLSSLLLPNIALAVFSLIFISYSHLNFMNTRKKEFGLFMMLGMSIKDIRKLIFVENTIIAGGAILLGSITGSVFSRLFFLIIIKALGIGEVSYSIGWENIFYAIGIFLLVYLVNVVITLICTNKFEVVQLLKADRTVQNNKSSKPILAVIGAVMIILGSIFLYRDFGNVEECDGALLFQSSLIIISGLYMLISQLGGVLIKFSKKNKDYYYKNALFLTSINNKFKQTKKIIFMLAMLVAVIIFYTGAMLNFYLKASNVEITNPYDITFLEVGENNIVLDNYTKNETIELICKNTEDGWVKVYVSSYDLEIDIDKGEQVYLGDVINNNDKSRALAYSLAREINIVNNDDYEKMKIDQHSYNIVRCQLYDVSNWIESQDVVDKLEADIKINQDKSPLNEAEVLKVRSKIDAYNYNKQGATLMLFTSAYLGLFFFIATAVILFLKLLSDIDKDKERFKSMYKIGMLRSEIKCNIGRELRPIFFIGPVIGVLISLIYTACFAKDSIGTEKIFFIGCSLIMSGIFFILQIGYYLICKKHYYNEILSSITKK